MKKLFDTKAKILSIVLAAFLLAGLNKTGFSQGMLISANAGTADASAMLDIVSTNKGLLAPRMTTTQRDAISSAVTGLLIYNTTTNAFNYYSGGWIALGTGNGTVTSFSAGTLSPLFTTSVANASTTPSLSFSLSNAGGYTIFGNNTGSSAAPAYFSPVLASALFSNQGTTSTVLHGNAAGNPSWGAIALGSDVTGTLDVANGGTGASTLTGYIKGSGTTALTAASTIPGSDISGNITGNAANVTGTIAVANGGTGATTLTGYVKGSGTSAVTASTTIPGSDISGNITGNAANITGTIAVTNGGTGATTLTGYIKGTGTTALTASATIPGGDITDNTIDLTSKVTGILSPANGGTGVNNTGNTITLGGDLTTSGSNAITLTSTAATNVTLPTTGTIATLQGIESISGLKTFDNTKIAIKGTSTGVTTLSSANSSATSYDITLPPHEGTLALRENYTTSPTTGGSVTLTAAQVVYAGIYVINTNATVTFPTAASLVAALPSPQVGDIIRFSIACNGNNTPTIAGNTRATIGSQTGGIARVTRHLMLRLTNVTSGSEAYVIY